PRGARPRSWPDAPRTGPAAQARGRRIGRWKGRFRSWVPLYRRWKREGIAAGGSGCFFGNTLPSCFLPAQGEGALVAAQKFFRNAARAYPSPLEGEGGSGRRSETDEGCAEFAQDISVCVRPLGLTCAL